MKQNETSWNTDNEDEPCGPNALGEQEVSGNAETPLREDAFVLDDDTKVELIQKHFKEIMQILGLDLTDCSLRGTPKRVAKMYVKEVFSGLNAKNKPHITLFDNNYQFDDMVAVRDINFYSMCEHHFLPFFGKAHVAYIPKEKVAGLSKINRLVQFHARKPQVQERLTIQIANEIRDVFHTDDVAVVLEANHLCVAARGVEDASSITTTSRFLGKFNEEEWKQRFLNMARK